MKIAMFHHQLREDLFGTFFNTQPSNPTLTLWVIFFLSTMVNQLENVFSKHQAGYISFRDPIHLQREHFLLLWIPEVRTSAGLEGGSLANEGFLRRLSFSGVMKKWDPRFGGMYGSF